MTAGHDGTPENDDPFAYLYRSEGGEQPDPAGGQPAAPYQQGYGQPGQPRTSHHQVQRVGERRPQGGYGYPQQPPPQQAQYGGAATTQQYQQPQAYDTPPPPPGGGRRGGGRQADAPNRKGLLIAAVAVVAAVAVGIAFAMTNGSGDKDNKAGGSTTTSAPATQSTPSQTPSPSATPKDFASGKVDASTLTLTGGAAKSNQWPGADAAGGTYVDNMGTPGASALWTVTVPADGDYTFFISYGNAGKDANLVLSVNGKPRSNPVNLKNYGSPPYTDWAKAWDNHTYQWVNLKKGSNTLALTCVPGVNCGVNLDQVWLKQGQVTQ